MFASVENKHLGDGAVWTIAQGAMRCYNAITNKRSHMEAEKMNYISAIIILLEEITDEALLREIFKIIDHMHTSHQA